MWSSVRLGRIAGIEFGVNWSWLVVFALIVWTLAPNVLGLLSITDLARALEHTRSHAAKRA